MVSPAAYSGVSASATRNALAQRRDIARTVPFNGRDFRLAHAGGQKTRKAWFVSEPSGEASEHHEERRAFCSGKQLERGAREDFECHHPGNRIAGKSEEELLPQAPEDERLTGLDQHAVEKEFCPKLREHGFHHIIFPG